MPVFLKWLGIGLLFVLIGLFLIQKDLRLRMWGTETKALITDAWVSSAGRFGTRKIPKLEYTFYDEKKQRIVGGFTPPSDWNLPEDLKVKVVYLSNRPEINRWAGESALWSYIVFTVGVILTGMGIHRFFNESVVDSHRTAEPINPYGKAGKVIDRMRG